MAEQYAARAFDAFGRQAYRDAVELYEKAYGAAPSADILYNLARVYDLGLGLSGRAIEYYRRYCAAPEADPERTAKSLRRVIELESQPTQPTRPAVEPPLRSTLRAPEIAPSTTRVGTEKPPASPPEGWSTLEIAAVSTSAVGALGVAVGVGYLISAQAENDTWKRDCVGNDCSSREGVRAARAAERKANIATLGFAAGGALIAVGVAAWLLEPSAEQDSAPIAGSRVLPVATTSDVRAVWSGSF